MRRIGNLLLLTALVGLVLSCSSGSPTIPSNDPAIAESSHSATAGQSHYLYGFYLLKIDSESGEVEVIPVRNADLHLNLTGVLNATMGVSASGVPSEADPVNGLFVMDITLEHPFGTKPQLAGFDVKGILMAPGSEPFDGLVLAAPDETHLENADGNTRWWNPSEFTTPGLFGYTEGILAFGPAASMTATINGYKYFADVLQPTDSMSWVTGTPMDADNGRGVFTAGSSNTRRYRIRFKMDPGPQVLYGYAIDASWSAPSPNPPVEIPDDFPIEANQPEPFYIAVAPRINTLYYDTINVVGGGYLQMQVNVHDWQGQDAGDIASEVGDVNLYIPDLTTTVFPATFLSEIPSKAKYVADITGIGLVGVGEYPVYCSVESTDGSTYQQTAAPAPAEPLKIYQVATVEIQEFPECVADLNNNFYEAVELGYTEGAPGIVCPIVDEWDYYSFTIPPGYEVSGDVTLYTDRDDTEFFLYDTNYMSIASNTVSTMLTTFNLDDYSLIQGTYYVGIQGKAPDPAFYHVQMNVALTEKNDIYIESEVTPPGLFCKPEYVWVDGPWAFFIGNYGLWVFNISTQTHPQQVYSEIYTQDFFGLRTSYSSDYMYLTLGNPGKTLSVLDLTDPSAPVLTDDVLDPEEFVYGTAMNSEYLVLTDHDVARFYDWPSDPTDPPYIVTYDVEGDGDDLVFYDPEGPDTHLLTASYDTIYSYDLESMPTITPDGSTTVLTGGVRKIVTRGDYIYVLAGSGTNYSLEIYQQGAGSIDFVGSENFTAWAIRLAVADDVAIVADTDRILHHISTATKASPVYMSFDNIDLMANDLFIDSAGDYMYTVLKNQGYRIDDISSFPMTLQYQTVAANNPRNVVGITHGSNDYLLIHDLNYPDFNSILTVDITDPAIAEVVGQLVLDDGQQGFIINDGDVVVATNATHEFSTIDATDPLNLVIQDTVGLVGFVKGLGLYNNTLYVSQQDGITWTIETYDVTNPASITYKGTVATVKSSTEFAFYGDYMYAISDYDATVYDITSPWIPVAGSAIPTAEPNPSDLKVLGDYLYLSTGSSFEISDLTDPAIPSLIGSTIVFSTPTAQAFDTDGQIAYFHGYSPSWPAVIDVDPPNDPQKVLTMDYIYLSTRDVLMYDGFLYMVSDLFGVRIYDLY